MPECTASGENSPIRARSAAADEEFFFEGEEFPFEGKQFLCEGEEFPFEGKQFLCEGDELPFEGKQFLCEGEELPFEGKQFLCEGEELPFEGKQFLCDEEEFLRGHGTPRPARNLRTRTNQPRGMCAKSRPNPTPHTINPRTGP